MSSLPLELVPSSDTSASDPLLSNGLTGGLKPTFLECFAKVYTYPYGNSFLPRERTLNFPSQDA